MGLRSLCSWTSWTHSSSQAQWQAWEELAVELEAGCNSLSKDCPQHFTKGVACSSLLPASCLGLPEASPTCLSLPPDIPAGGWDTGQRKKRKKTKETKQVEGGPCAPVAPGPPHSSSLLFPLPSLYLFSFPFSHLLSSLHLLPPPSIPCLPGAMILMI